MKVRYPTTLIITLLGYSIGNEPMSRMKITPTPGGEGNNAHPSPTPNGEEDSDFKFIKRKSFRSSIGDENIHFLSNNASVQEAISKRMERYTISLPNMSEGKYGVTLDQIYAASKLAKREIISMVKREQRLSRKKLETSEARISYFKRELAKNRISFLEDSLTLVIDRENIVEHTLNQIESLDGFSFHKEIKIFFVGEEAQDAGGVLKEWIFHLCKLSLISFF